MKVIESSYIIEDKVDGMEMLKKIERAGRNCYKSEDKITDDSAIAFIKKILKMGHESIIEHEKITVRFICDRGVTHEMVRHRISSFSQESTRYANYSKDRFGGEITVIPLMDGLTQAQIARRCALYNAIEEIYMAELDEGIKPQQARDNLPTCLKSEMVWTANLREWRHILQLRTAQAAHPAIRKLMIPLLKEFRQLIPIMFDDVGTTEF